MVEKRQGVGCGWSEWRSTGGSGHWGRWRFLTGWLVPGRKGFLLLPVRWGDGGPPGGERWVRCPPAGGSVWTKQLRLPRLGPGLSTWTSARPGGCPGGTGRVRPLRCPRGVRALPTGVCVAARPALPGGGSGLGSGCRGGAGRENPTAARGSARTRARGAVRQPSVGAARGSGSIASARPPSCRSGGSCRVDASAVFRAAGISSATSTVVYGCAVSLSVPGSVPLCKATILLVQRLFFVRPRTPECLLFSDRRSAWLTLILACSRPQPGRDLRPCLEARLPLPCTARSCFLRFPSFCV